MSRRALVIAGRGFRTGARPARPCFGGICADAHTRPFSWDSDAVLRSLSVVVIVLLASTGCSDHIVREHDQPVESVATAGPETGDLLLHGELTNEGKPATNGKVWVSLFADEDAQEGDVIPTWESAVATSDDRGKFAVSVDPERLNSKFFNGEYLNYEINVLQDDSWATWHTTSYLVAQGVWRSEEAALVGDPMLHVAVDLVASTITLTDDTHGESETKELTVLRDVPTDTMRR
jgi:hypothetical protein